MGDYVIWLGESIKARIPHLSWEEIMEIITFVPLSQHRRMFNRDIDLYLEYLEVKYE